MIEKKDIEERAELERMLEIFYQKAFKDDLISHFFLEVVPLNLETHIPVITDFWESVLLDGRNNKKNVMEIHLNISEKSKIGKEHLDRWVKLFTETVEEMFEGPKAALAKQRATSIATMMHLKIDYPNPLKK